MSDSQGHSLVVSLINILWKLEMIQMYLFLVFHCRVFVVDDLKVNNVNSSRDLSRGR